MCSFILSFCVIYVLVCSLFLFFFFFNDTATTEIYTLSLHDALPIYSRRKSPRWRCWGCIWGGNEGCPSRPGDRKSTRLNSSHGYISYAVFCLKKKKNTKNELSPNKRLTLSLTTTTYNHIETTVAPQL